MKYYPMFDLFDDFFTGNTTSDVMKTDIVEKDGKDGGKNAGAARPL